MSGVAITRAILIADTAMIAAVGSSSIVAGDIPQGMALPAISLESISMIPVRTLAMNEADRLFIERVQVTAHTKTSAATPAGTGYPELKSIMAQVLATIQNQRGSLAGFFLDSIIPDYSGPDLVNPDTGIISASHDFVVKWKNA